MKHLVALFAVLAILLTGCTSTTEETPDEPRGATQTTTPKNKPHGPDRKLRNAPDIKVGEVAGESACFTDGQEGPRVQAVYVVSSDKPDRHASQVANIRAWAAGMDTDVNSSAATQGYSAHIRWACVGGLVDVAKVVTTPTGDDTFAAVRTSLQSAGFNRTDRKYMIWADTTDGAYCGISQTYSTVNYAPSYGQVNVGCWGQTNRVELHELMHGLGAVAIAAPNSNGAWHCTDESDRMCYNDGSGAVLTYPCASANEKLLDCNRNDYFDVRPDSTVAVNAARSNYLVVTPGATSPSPTPTAFPSATASPSPTVTKSPSPTPTCYPRKKPRCR